MGRFTTWWLNLRLRSSLALGGITLVGMLGLGALVVHLTEGWGWLDSFYFAVASLTTVGYGDLVPANDATKVFLIFYLPLGIAVGLTVLGLLGAEILEARRRYLQRRHESSREHTGHG